MLPALCWRGLGRIRGGRSSTSIDCYSIISYSLSQRATDCFASEYHSLPAPPSPSPSPSPSYLSKRNSLSPSPAPSASPSRLAIRHTLSPSPSPFRLGKRDPLSPFVSSNHRKLGIMGAVVGKIRAETPKYTVIDEAEGFEVREYDPAMAAAVTYAGDIYRSDDLSNPFRVLARYIGVFTSPENVKAEAIAMTAPVVMLPPSASSSSSTSTKLSDGGSLTGKAEGERISMTAPVLLQTSGSHGRSSKSGEEEGKQGGEKIEMTAPVVLEPTAEMVVGTTGREGEVGDTRDSSAPSPSPSPSASSAQSPPPAGSSTMMFILPTKYTRLDMVPKPVDPRVVIVELPRRKLAVIRFSGVAGKEVTQQKEEQLLQGVAKAGFKVVGKPALMVYNPPFTLPMFRTNEVYVAVE